MLVRAFAYIMVNGSEGLKNSAYAVLANANYMMARLKKTYHLPYDRFCKHEFVLSGKSLAQYGVKTLDVAKRLARLLVPCADHLLPDDRRSNR